MTTTPHYSIPIPDDAATVEEEFRRLQQAWELVDTILKTLSDLVAGKAASVHSHPIDQINGLVSALQNKMDASKTFRIGDLTDVVGSADAALNYVLAKNNDGKFSFASALSLLGNHDHTMAQVVGLISALAGKVNKTGEIFTGGVTVPTFAINGLDIQDQVLMFQKGGISRFAVFVDSLGTFNIGKYADDGNWNGGILSINRQSGKMTLAEQLIALKGIDIRGNATFLNEVLAPTFVVKENPGNFSIVRWLRGNLPAFDISLNPAQDFQLNTFANDGGFLFNPLYISRLTGVTTVNNIRLGNKANAGHIAAGTPDWFPDAAAVKAALAPFTSGQQSYVINGLGSVAHGLGAKPQKLSSQIFCTTASNGYSVGDEIEMASGTQPWPGQGSFGIHLWADASNIYWKIGNAGIAILNKSNGGTDVAPTANWQLRLKAAL